MIPDLAQQIMDYRTRDKDRRMKPAGIRISEIGHPCARYLVHSVLDWDKAKTIDAGLALIFEEGKMQEMEIVRDLMAIRAKFWGQQDAVSWDEFGLVGHPDGKVYTNDEQTTFAVVEIKSLNPNWAAKMKTEEDLLNFNDLSRKYYAQLQAYMLLLNTEDGIFLMKNKSTGEITQINVRLDLTYAEGLLKKAKLAWSHIQAKTYPDKINCFGTCSKCRFAHVCCPDLIPEKKQIIASEQIAELLDRKEEIEDLASEYNQIMNTLKKSLPSVDGEFLCGHWAIKQKISHRKAEIEPRKAYSCVLRDYERIPDDVMILTGKEVA